MLENAACKNNVKVWEKKTHISNLCFFIKLRQITIIKVLPTEKNGLKDISEDIIVKLNEPFFLPMCSHTICNIYNLVTSLIKRSLTRDFRLQAFSTNQFPPGPWVSSFVENNFVCYRQ